MPDVSQTSLFISCQSKKFQRPNVLRTFVGFSRTHWKLKLNSGLWAWSQTRGRGKEGAQLPCTDLTPHAESPQRPVHLWACSGPQARRLHAATHGCIISSYARAIFPHLRAKILPCSYQRELEPTQVQTLGYVSVSRGGHKCGTRGGICATFKWMTWLQISANQGPRAILGELILNGGFIFAASVPF